MKRWLPTRAVRILLAALLVVGLSVFPVAACHGQLPATTDETVLSEGFEQELPDFHTYQARYSADTSQAHSGSRSLRVSPTARSGGAYFRLDGVVDLKSDYEFSAWVYAGAPEAVRLYISASDGKQRHMKAQAAGGRAGQWAQLTGVLRGEDWKATDCEVMLAMSCGTESWFDDVVLRKTTLPEPPIRVYPQLAGELRAMADRSKVRVASGAEITLSAGNGALLDDFQAPGPRGPENDEAVIPPDGLLTFALDVPAPLYVTGSLRLTSTDDLRPGLRAYVLCDDTVIAAPMVTAEPWQGEGNPLTGPAPNITGPRPPEEIQLATWLLPAGRHYLTVAGPHFRSAGTFRQLRIRPLDRPVEEPLYRFALLSDTHLGSGRAVWMNTKLGGPAKEELAATLAALKRENVAWAVIAGDMTDHGTREQFEALGKVCRNSGLAVYGCIGNHDSYRASSRPDALELCPELFPCQSTDYVIDEPPLRLIVLDAAHWKSKDGRFVDHYDPADSGGIGLKPEQIDWLKRELARDVHTPTIIISHFPLHYRGGLSSCGYKLPVLSTGSAAMEVLRQAPNAVAMLCGHTHWNEYNPENGIAHIVNPAFCEWPNAYRLFRVYQDRVEWELRQVPNRGFIRESFVAPKALSWMISTADDDLTGTAPFSLSAERRPE